MSGRRSRDVRKLVTALAVYEEEAQHARLRRAHAVPRWLRSGHALSKGTAPGERPLFLGARPCSDVPAVASDEQPAFAAHTSAPLRWLSAGRRRSTRACDARAPRRDGCGRYMSYGRALHQREAFLLRCKTVLQHASCGLE